MKKLICVFFLCLAFPCYAHAFMIDEKLPTREMEERAEKIYSVVRCLVCSGETLQESRSNFATALRSSIRQEILNGRTDKEILDALSKSYGSKVLSITPYAKETYFLWYFPIFAAFAISSMFAFKFRKLIKAKIDT